MNKHGIQVSCSWEVTENFIECLKNEAWNKMLELAFKEIKTVTNEMAYNDYNIDIIVNPKEMEIELYYHYDNEICCYKYIEY